MIKYNLYIVDNENSKILLNSFNNEENIMNYLNTLDQTLVYSIELQNLLTGEITVLE